MMSLQLPSRPMHVLALGAHPDDIEIGCGGTLLKLAERPHVTATAVVATASPERLDEARRAFAAFLPGVDASVESLGLPDSRLPAYWGDLKDGLEKVAVDIQPDIIFAPRLDDGHQDHRLLADMVTGVWRNHLVLRYEIPKWSGDMGRTMVYTPLDENLAQHKLNLLNTCYVSQTHRDWWDDHTFLGLMRLRGIECRAQFAEGFTIEKVPLQV